MAKPEIGATWYEPVYRNGTRKEGNWNIHGGTADLKTDFGNGPNGVIAESIIPDNGTIRFNITEAVKKWIAREIPNYGLLLRVTPKVKDETDTVFLYSSDYTGTVDFRPSLSITYKGKGYYSFSGYELVGFDGFPGKKVTLTSGKKGSFSLSAVLVRDSSPTRTERRSSWRGRIGNFDGSFNRVLMSTGKLISMIPTGAGIINAKLNIQVKESDESRMDFWHIRNRWDPTSVNWGHSSEREKWGTPGCSGSADRNPERAAVIRLEKGKEFPTEIDLTAPLNRILSRIEPDYGFLITAADEYSDSIRFYTEDTDERKTAPVLTVTYFISDLTDFTPLFDTDEPGEMRMFGTKKPSFNGDNVIIPSDGGLIRQTGTDNGFLICGEYRRLDGQGWVDYSINHEQFGKYRVQLGDRYRVVLDRGNAGGTAVLWEHTPDEIPVGSIHYEISALENTLYLKAGNTSSGALSAKRIDPSEIRIKGVSSYTELTDTVIGLAK